MELDNLKENWKIADQRLQYIDYNLDTLLQEKANGPLDTLKKKFKRELITLPMAALLLISLCFFVPEMRKNAFVLIAIPLLLIQAVRYFRSYQVILQMQRPIEKGLKQHLEENLQTLKRDALWDQNLKRGILILFIIGMEITLYFRLVPAYQGWGDVNYIFRAGIYLLLLILQPYVTKYFFNYHFGQHLSRMQEVVNQAA